MNVRSDLCEKQHSNPCSADDLTMLEQFRWFADAKVSVQCKDKAGKVVDYAQASTNFLGDFMVSFKGKEDLSGCYVYLSGSADSKCNIVGGGGKTLSLKSKFLFKAMYVADPLFYKPAKPMGFCPKQGGSSPGRGITVPFPNRKPSTCSCWCVSNYLSIAKKIN